MSDPVVVDASAVLALIFGEPGAERVDAVLAGAQISAVNYIEVLTKLIDRGDEPDLAVADLAEMDIVVVPLSNACAEAAGRLRTPTRRAGLSLGDRACLALAKAIGGRAVTCDRAWAEIANTAGVKIEVVR